MLMLAAGSFTPGTAIVLLIVALVIGAIIFSMIRNKKKGKSSCSCGCKGCPNSSLCHSDNRTAGH